MTERNDAQNLVEEQGLSNPEQVCVLSDKNIYDIVANSTPDKGKHVSILAQDNLKFMYLP